MTIDVPLFFSIPGRMNYQKILLLFIFAASTGVVSSCKKKSSSSGSNLLATVDYNSGGSIEHYRFVYNPDNSLDSMVITGGGLDTGNNGFKYFKYAATSYVITDQNNYSFTVYDSGGLVEEVVIPDTLIFTYNGSVLSTLIEKTQSIVPPYYSEVVSDYSWANGDITSLVTAGGATESYNYNTGRSGEIGDGCRIDYFLAYGQPIIKTSFLPTELLSSVTIGGWLEQYYYQFDNSGRISQMIKVGNNGGTGVNDTTVYTYSYYY
jgi:hypothetical protein